MKFLKKSNFVKTLQPLILASNSPIRHNILQKTGIEFKVIPSSISESDIKKNLTNTSSIGILAKSLAKAKALNVSKNHDDSFVIGADQICVCSNQILSKPENKREAYKQLKKINGGKHIQYSAVSICYNGKVLWSYLDKVELNMKKMNNKEINIYIERDKPLNCCGSYKFESLGYHLFKNIKGNENTVKGLPLLPLLSALRDLKVYSL